MVITTHCMKLAAMAKRMRTKKARRKRYQNNKLFSYDQKVFYNTLKNGEQTNVDKPPTKMKLKDSEEV